MIDLFLVPDFESLRQGSKLSPFDLERNHLLPFAAYKHYFKARQRAKQLNVKMPPISWDGRLPTNCWVWKFMEGPYGNILDRSLCRVEQISSDVDIFSAFPHTKSASKMSDESVKISYAKLIEDVGIENLTPLDGYKFRNQYYIFDGHKRLAGARALGAPIRILVDQVSEEGLTTPLIDYALIQSKRSSLLKDLASDSNVVRSPEHRQLFGYQTKRTQYYPKFGDQLEAIWDLLNRIDAEQCVKHPIYKEILNTKARFPKTQDSLPIPEWPGN